MHENWKNVHRPNPKYAEKRMNGHFNDVRKRENLNEKTESFVDHFHDIAKIHYGDCKPKKL